MAQAAAGKTANPQQAGLKIASFGTGCFWCTESDFDKVEGVVATISGYMGGKTKNPTYQQVSSGRTGHAEIVQITYDPTKVTYDQLLHKFWRTVDPHNARGQFCDGGSQYRPVIFTHDADQRRKAEASKLALEKSGKLKQPIVVEITDASEFTRAEEYHQDFYKKNPGHYYFYRQGCGRDARLRQIWGAEAGQ
ncbi:MAG: Peptide methionine sulfoxide reductase MsrA [Pseudomonadota bacterium]|jgi:peptide-methionine (S)-S-oxide reductase